MRWLKHMSNASDDEFLVGLEAIFGLHGYARWWKLLEVVAVHMDKSDRTSVTYPWDKWESILKGKRKQLDSFLVALENQGRCIVIRNGNEIEISVPKLLKFRDEYSKKSGHYTDKNHDKLRRKDTETDTDTKQKPLATNVAMSDLFKEFWEVYPRKVKKPAALKVWKRLKPDEQTLNSMTTAIARQSKTDQWERGYIPHPATWLNNRQWEDRDLTPGDPGLRVGKSDVVNKPNDDIFSQADRDRMVMEWQDYCDQIGAEALSRLDPEELDRRLCEELAAVKADNQEWRRHQRMSEGARRTYLEFRIKGKILAELKIESFDEWKIMRNTGCLSVKN